MVRGFNQEAIRRATTKIIILDELSFSHVENSRIRHFFSVACPRFVVPSRRTITKDILDIFLARKASLKSLLCDKKQRVSLTIDIWTSITTASYMIIAAHFIDKIGNYAGGLLVLTQFLIIKGRRLVSTSINVCLIGV